MVICLKRGADLHMSQIGFTFLVPAHPGSPRQRDVKRVCNEFCIQSFDHDNNQLIKIQLPVKILKNLCKLEITSVIIIPECHCLCKVVFTYTTVILNSTWIIQLPGICTVQMYCKYSETYPYCRASSVEIDQTNAVQKAAGNLPVCLCMHTVFPSQRRKYSCPPRKIAADQFLIKRHSVPTI